MNSYPLWRYLLLAAALTLGTLYALPNLYGEDPSVQISPLRNAKIDDPLIARIDAALKKANLPAIATEQTPGKLLLRFGDDTTQLRAKDLIVETLGNAFMVALNLAPRTPDWLRAIGAKPMYLGLDLRGGVHFLMEVDAAGAARQADERYVSEIRAKLRDDKVRYGQIGRQANGGILITFKEEAARKLAVDRVKRDFPELTQQETAGSGGSPEFELRLVLKEQALKESLKGAVQQNITILRNRVNELGVAEPIIQQQGLNRIVVQLPGVQDTVRAKEILGATATLEFRMVDDEHSVQEAEAGRVPPSAKLYTRREGGKILLKKRVILTGEYIIDAQSGLDPQSSTPDVSITLDGKGAKSFANTTREQVGRAMAVIFIENKVETEKRGTGATAETVKVRKTVEEVINVATIREQLGKRFHITGLSSTDEARNLALLLRAGSLAAPIEIVEERTVGPSAGKENIARGFLSAEVGFGAVVFFMMIYYRLFGIFASMALAANMVLVVALLSIIQATLTLPGIAGIVLTVGMAVDANVLINERIREELRNGSTAHAAIEAGYEKAFATIADSNITTLIAGLVLFGVGSGPVKGFAVTLCLGILTSMFTAISGTRALVELSYGRRRVKDLSI